MNINQLIDLMPDMVCLADNNGKVMHLNPAWKTVLGYDISDFSSFPFLNFTHAVDRKDFEETYKNWTDKTIPLNFENRMLTKGEDDYRWISWHICWDSTTEHMLILGKDISTSKRLEYTNFEIEKAAKIGSWFYHVAADELIWSRGVFRIHGIPFVQNHSIPSSSGIDFYHPDDQAIIKDAFEQCTTKGVPYNLILRIIRADGNLIYVNAIAEPIFNDQGKVVQVQGVFQDVDTEVRRKRELDNTNKRFNLALLTSTDGVFDWMDINENELWWSSTIFQMIGYKESEFTASFTNFLTLVHPDDVTRVEKTLQESLNNNTALDMDFRVKPKIGKYIWVKTKGEYISVQKNNSYRLIGTVADITVQKEAEQKLKITNEALGYFINLASHDLKDPISKINMSSDWLLQKEGENLSAKGKELFKLNMKSVQHLNAVIDNLIVYTQELTRSQKNQQVDLNTVLERVKSNKKLKHQLAHTQLSAEKLPKILGVPTNWEMIFENLVSNSLKFKKRNTPLKICIKYAPLKNNHHQITYQDNGVGFSNDLAHKIFDPFRKLHSTEEFDGTGMGMAIVSKIVENHNGKIEASGEVEKGATFTITLPFQ